MIEDACEALDAEHQGVRVGTLADAGVFAFYAITQMTTGEGCMLVTRSRSVADKVRSLRNQGRTQEDWFEHATIGYNYRLSEMQAAPGLSQLRRIDKMLALRTEVARLYACALADANDLTLPLQPFHGHISWFVYVVRLTERFGRHERDPAVAAMRRNGVARGRYFAPVHRQGANANAAGLSARLQVIEFVAERTLALPFLNRLTAEEVIQVSEGLQRASTR